MELLPSFEPNYNLWSQYNFRQVNNFLEDIKVTSTFSAYLFYQIYSAYHIHGDDWIEKLNKHKQNGLKINTDMQAYCEQLIYRFNIYGRYPTRSIDLMQSIMNYKKKNNKVPSLQKIAFYSISTTDNQLLRNLEITVK
jgi:hypothetical protein